MKAVFNRKLGPIEENVDNSGCISTRDMFRKGLR